MFRQYFSNRTKKLQYISACLVIFIVAGIGTYLLIGSHAATPYASTTADSGTLANGAAKKTCSGASDGSCVAFNGESSGSCPLSSFTATNQPACFTFYSSSSPFNTQLPANPQLVSNSSAIINYMENSGWAFETSGKAGYPGPAFYDGSRAVFFAHPTDPLVKLTSCSGDCNNYSGANIVGTSFHVPQGAMPYSNTDAHFTVVETDTGAEYDFWETSVNWSNDTMTATYGDEDNVITGSGVPGNYAGAEASNNPLLAGLMRPSEVLAAQTTDQINHALILDVACVQSISPPVWPSTKGEADSSCNNANAPHFGTLLKLNWTDAQIKASSAYPWEQGIMYALAHYGAYIVDTNGAGDNNIYIFRQSANSWTDLGAENQWSVVDPMITGGVGGSNPYIQSNVAIPISALEVVDPCVQQHQC